MAAANPALTFALALAAGMVAQAFAHHLRVPGIVVLLLTGVLLGPDVLNVVRPESLGHGLELLVGLSVAVILFEGGLNLSIGRLRREAVAIRRLILFGAVVTAVGATLVSHFLMDWEWRVAVLFGTLVIVTGPTVINPLLRRIRVKRNVETVLEAEGVLIDPIGAIIAVVALEVVLSADPSSAAVGLLGIPLRVLVGAAVGAGGGLAIGLLLRRERLVPEGLESGFALALVLAMFEIGEAIAAESGILAAVVAGLVVGNMRTGVERELKEFKERITVMLIGLLFVLLAADVRIADVVGLGWGGLAVVAALMLVVRPIVVALSTRNASLSLRERAFIAWIGPRGIVAAAVSSLFAQRLEGHGIDAGVELRALVFLVIAVTVIVQGGSGGFVAQLLGVRRPRHSGYIIVGANAVGRALGRVLASAGEDVVVIDTNAHEAGRAEEEGLSVIFGNANDEGPLTRAGVANRRGFIAATPNPGINLLLATRARDLFRVPRAYVALQRGRSGVQPDQARDSGAAVLFGRPIDLDPWRHRIDHGIAAVHRWRYRGPDRAIAEPEIDIGGSLDREASLGADWIPLAIERGGLTIPVDDRTRVRDGDIVFALAYGERDALRVLMDAHGWEATEDSIVGEPAMVPV